MRFSPANLDIVWVAGYGQHPSAPMVTITREDGTVLPLAPGHDPRWNADLDVLWCPQTDGRVQSLTHGPDPFLPAGNSLTVASGRMAVHRTDPIRTLCSWGWVLPGETDPVLSADGTWLVTLVPDVPRDRVSTVRLRDTRSGPQMYRDLYIGAPLQTRFSHVGTSLCWEDTGQIFGIADVANPASPVTRLSRPADKLSKPVPLWVPMLSGLFVLAIQDQSDLGLSVVIEWGSAAVGRPVGFLGEFSSGAGYDHDIKPEGWFARVAYLLPNGVLDRFSLRLLDNWTDIPLPPTTPAPKPEPEPDPYRWDLVPDGTLVTDAIRLVVGDTPQIDADGVICLHKNTYPEAEWRRIAKVNGRVALLHWADASRVPGDPGWWTEPAAILCYDTFRSGEVATLEQAVIVDKRPDVPPNRWRQTVTMRGIVGGGIFYAVDPRFANQYTDMTKRGTPDWAPAGREEQWICPDGWSRWRYIVTPLTARGRIPWGDPALDVVIQETITAPQPDAPPAPPLPFVPCPRPLNSPVDPKPNPKPEPTMNVGELLRAIPRDQTIMAAEAIHEYLIGNPSLGDGWGMLPTNLTGATLAEILDRPVAYLFAWAGHLIEAGPLPGADAGAWQTRRNLALDATFHQIQAEKAPITSTPPIGGGGPFRGPIRAEGESFTLPD